VQATIGYRCDWVSCFAFAALASAHCCLNTPINQQAFYSPQLDILSRLRPNLRDATTCKAFPAPHRSWGMTFYSNTGIEYWQSLQHSALRRAFEESRNRHTLSRGDRELPKGRFRHDLLAVNSFSRRIWGRAVSNELSRFFCDGGDGTTHNRNVYFVSIMDVTCARSPEDRLPEADLEFIKNRLRYGLRKFSYFGMVEPAYYVNLQAGVRCAGKRCMFWHLHALVWGVSHKELKKRLRKLVQAGHYAAIADGLDATHTRKIQQGVRRQII
jgi:hypothetical protein